MRLPWALSALLLLAAAGCTQNAKQPALAKAAEYLWSLQGEDGGWHSHTYGLLRSGQSLTPFVLEALLQIPADIGPPHDRDITRAISFIKSNTLPDGSLGTADPRIPDYPNYSTAFALGALRRAKRPGWEEQVRRMTVYLRSQQFTEQNGWHKQDQVYGAWGMGGDRRTPPGTGHVDLSMTRYVVEALRAAAPTSDPIFESARVFIERCQNFDPKHPDDSDGGFFFSTTEFDTNKAGHDGQHFRSYGTTTADGILALLAAGAHPNDARVVAAKRWLAKHHRDMNVPGFVGEAYQRWPRGLAFYYSAAILQAAPDTGATVVDGLQRTQRPDGSWSNPENLVKEDDPLIATPFAIRALVAGSNRQRESDPPTKYP
jgi:hypothetical protein